MFKGLVNRFGVGLVGGLAGVAVLFRALAGKDISGTLWGNDLDPHLIVWTVEWGFHTIFERLAPLDVWNANSYFPHIQSLAYSDSILSAQLFYAPLRLLGVGMVPALYMTLASFCILGSCLTDRLLQPYGLAAAERLLVVIAAHFSLSMTAFLIGHYQLFGMQLVPPLLLAVHRLFDRGKGRDLVLVTALFCLAGGFATYVIPMAGLVALLLLVTFAFSIVRRRGLTDIIRTLGWKGPAVSLVLVGLFFVIQLRPYLSIFRDLPPQSMSETQTYSARPWSIFLHPAINSFWYSPPGINNGYWERAAFPGVPLLLLAAIGGLAVLGTAPAWRLEKNSGSAISLAAFAAAVFAICWILSWGPYLQLCSCSEDKVRLPFLVFANFIPGVENIRAPGRYAQFFGLPLGLVAVVGVRWISARLHVAVSGIAAALALLVLVDQMQKVPTYLLEISHADFFRGAKNVIQEGEPIIVLPIAGADHLGTWSNRVRQLESSTIHWAKLVTGAGSRDTPELNELITLDVNLRANAGSLTDIVAFARRLGIGKLVVFPGDYPPPARDTLVNEVRQVGGQIVLEVPEGVVIALTP